MKRLLLHPFKWVFASLFSISIGIAAFVYFCMSAILSLFMCCVVAPIVAIFTIDEVDDLWYMTVKNIKKWMNNE